MSRRQTTRNLSALMVEDPPRFYRFPLRELEYLRMRLRCWYLIWICFLVCLGSQITPGKGQPLLQGIEGDVACCYAPSYAASVGGQANANVILANAVVGNNFVNLQSGTGARMRIAGFYQSSNDPVNWTTTGGMANWLYNNDSRVADVVAFGSSVGADLVLYVCQNSDSSSIAAVAQEPGMYSVFNPNSVWYVVLAHETGGHNYGRTHNDGLVSPKTIMLHNYCGGGATPPYFYTNPRIWLNGVRLQGNTNNNCNMGDLKNGGDNSSPNPQSVADRRLRPTSSPALHSVVLRWVFTNAPGPAPAGTVFYDLVCGAPAMVRGIGATNTGRAIRLPGGTTGNVPVDTMAAYIDLPNRIISIHTNITIEVWVALLSTQNWARIFDFGRTAQAGDGLGEPGEYTGAPGSPAPGVTTSYDDVMLSGFIGTDICRQRFELRFKGGTQRRIDSGLITSTGVVHHYAVTFTKGVGTYAETGGRWQWYRDGYPIGYVDVSNSLADLEDVNNWLGRSMWSTDNNTHADYYEVRIHNVALSERQILANYLVGPQYFPVADVYLTNSDNVGSSSFNDAGNWSDGAAPSWSKSYETYNHTLRTPATGANYTFTGRALSISGGTLIYKGTASSTITITNLILDGGVLHHGGSSVWTMAGNIFVKEKGAAFNAVNSQINVTANISGSGSLVFLGNTVTLRGMNSNFTGRIYIGNGAVGSLELTTPNALGAAPTNFIPDLIVMNRGTLRVPNSMSLTNSNMGILLNASGGTFYVGPNATFHLSCPISTPVTAPNIVVGALTKSGPGTLVLASSTNAFRGTVFVDTGATSGSDGILRIASASVLANAVSPIFIRNNNSASSTLALNGATQNIVLPQSVYLAGRNTSVPAILNEVGTNTISGGITLATGGSYYLIQCDSGQLNIGGSIYSEASGTRTLTFQGAGVISVSGSISDGSGKVGITKNQAGTLILAGNNTYTGPTVVNGGTLIVGGQLSTGSVSVLSGGMLSGNGLIRGPVTIQSGGSLSPGIGIGSLFVWNSVTLNDGARTIIELHREYNYADALGVSGTLTCGGTLLVTNLGGQLRAGDNYRVFAATTLVGEFSNVTLPELAEGLAWSTAELYSGGRLWVVSTTPPRTTNIASRVNGVCVSGVGGTPGYRYYVKASKDLTIPVKDWPRVATNNFAVDGTFSFELPVESSAQHEFFTVEVEW